MTIVYAGVDQDLESARALVEDLPWKENPQKYRKPAETILRRVLQVDPGNRKAMALMSKAQAPLPSRSSFEVGYVVNVAAKPAPKKQERQKSGYGFLLVAAAGVIGIVMLARHWTPQKAEYVATASASAATIHAIPVSSEAPPVDAPLVDLLPSTDSTSVAEEIAAPPLAPAVPANTAAAPAPAAKPPAQPAVLPEKGTLALSSPTTVDIYSGDKYLASLPTTLELPAGTHTLEYRHLDQRKLVNHVVRPNETTTATITFDVTVQINAKPWAQVFIEGSPRQPLGQTPLSDVRVPIGTVLAFENPNFSGKIYRVTGTESEIRISFP